jgi:hypothetical protein
MQAWLELRVSPNRNAQFDLTTDEQDFGQGIGRIGS